MREVVYGMQGIRLASGAARDNTDEFARFVAERFRLPLRIAQGSIAREMSHYELDGRMDLPGLAKAIEVLTSPQNLTDLRFLPQ